MSDESYNPQNIEETALNLWKENNSFNFEDVLSKPSYTIILPPPNVTGSLHLGHSLCFTLQDILIRYKRILGFNVLWQAGLDHAGIVTQLLVEKKLTSEGVDCKKLRRNELIDKIHDWTKESRNTILNQISRLGCSMDIQKTRFTMDEQSNKAVIETFIKLFNDGLIYKDTRLVNWDPKLKSAISDLEVIEKEQKGKLYYIHYKIENSNKTILVATTRPETLFGDSAIAVNPDDERYKDMVGKNAIVPICNRVIPIIADEHSDPLKGSGAVKITPAHDFNDFEVGKRHNLEEINIFDTNATLNKSVPEKYIGLDRYEARKIIIQDLESLNAIEKIEDIKHVVPFGDRSGVVIEPYITEQWFLDAKKLAGPAIEAVKSGKIKFYPKNWENTYFEWMNNIKPWCISRQIIWGHQIPAWYSEDGKVFVTHSEEEAYKQAEEYYSSKSIKLVRDKDVLDTWYSSSLWPFCTQNWPNFDKDIFARHYPNNVLITGFDIIFFWVSRMIMMGIYFNKDVPFKHVYIHSLVRDAHGNKMSKSKGNVVDPMELINEFGADALRFAMASFATPGRDICISKERINGYKNFLKKIWNAVKFANMNDCFKHKELPNQIDLSINKWIIHQFSNLLSRIDNSISNYRFDEYANSVYKFFWGDFCDWYIEFSKQIFINNDTQQVLETRSVTYYIIHNFLKILSPIAPFLTEYLNKEYFSEQLIIDSSIPENITLNNIETSLTEISFLQELITEIRSIRKELNIPFSIIIEFNTNYNLSKENIAIIEKLAKVKYCTRTDSKMKFIVNQFEVMLFIDNFDLEAPKKRLSLELIKIENSIDISNNMLNNPKFIEKASQNIIDETRNRLCELNSRSEKIRKILSN